MRYNMKCPICSKNDFIAKYEINHYRIVQCNECYLVLLDKSFSQKKVIKFYETDYFDNSKIDKGYENYLLMEKALRKNFGQRADKIIKDFRKNKKIDLLDVGAGYGFFVDECTKRGIKAEGLEISKEALSYAKKIKIKMHAGAFEDFKPGKKYDAVTLWDVIEHIYDPNVFLEKISQILKPNGSIYLSTGNVESLAAKMSKAKWHLFNLPEHLYFYSEKSLKKLLEKNKFKAISIRYPNNYFTLGYILERLAKKILRINDTGKIQKITNSNIAQSIYIPVNLYDIMELKIAKR